MYYDTILRWIVSDALTISLNWPSQSRLTEEENASKTIIELNCTHGYIINILYFYFRFEGYGI